MKKDMVELVCMIDKSISMKGKEKKAIQMYNSLIEDYKEMESKCFVTTCLFSEKVNMLYLHNEVSFVKPLSEREYFLEQDREKTLTILVKNGYAPPEQYESKGS